jgi:hypothetical protein
VQACLRAEKLSNFALTANWGSLCPKERCIEQNAGGRSKGKARGKGRIREKGETIMIWKKKGVKW